ncbi:MAG: pyruvate carboxylase subunit B, partial [Dehalococcoidia bacterium]|nr:pyruvate carboxylase subunit B [Dehalococcoidia bacterium]
MDVEDSFLQHTPLKITDTTIRDGHQSALATRMRTEHMEALAEDLDNAGFYSIEVWGGATFDVTTRYLNEDPWERVTRLKKLMPKTPFQMLLRGQNLVGYRHYADDVVRSFIHHSADVGIDIFRVFDAVNDERNFESSFKAIKETGKHIQGTICYSLTERRLGGPVYNLEYFVSKAKLLEDMGADSICLKDMAGLISPYDTYILVKALKEALKVPLQMHTHYTSGMASMSYLKAVEAGIDILDCALAPFALRSSQPAVEPLIATLYGTPRDTGLDIELMLKLDERIEAIAPLYRDFLDNSKMAVIDTGVLVHQIPGGMLSNLVSQLKEADALDRIEEVYQEIPRARKEMGYPPLVTPTSQIVGVQAVQNVLFGRYNMVSGQVRDYMYGLYGRPPVPVDPEIQKKVLEGYERGEQPITGRPGDVLKPEMLQAEEDTKGIAKDEKDVLIYALYPTTGLRFLKWKYGLEPVPADVMPKTMEQTKLEDELIARARAGQLVEPQVSEAPPKGPGLRTFNIYVGNEYFKVEVEAEGGNVIVVQPPVPTVTQVTRT